MNWLSLFKRKPRIASGTKLPNGEYHCEWTCPRCAHFQHDSVHPIYGPFITCTCANCGKCFDDLSLDAKSNASFEAARLAAEKEAGVCRSCGFTFDRLDADGYCHDNGCSAEPK
jgi:hypothetical protein